MGGSAGVSNRIGSYSLDGSDRRLTFRVTVTVCATAAEVQSNRMKPAAPAIPNLEWKGLGLLIDASVAANPTRARSADKPSYSCARATPPRNRQPESRPAARRALPDPTSRRSLPAPHAAP